MIAESAIGVNGMLHLTSELWLRQACRRTTNTAKDAIFFSTIYTNSPPNVEYVFYHTSLMFSFECSKINRSRDDLEVSSSKRGALSFSTIA